MIEQFVVIGILANFASMAIVGIINLVLLLFLSEKEFTSLVSFKAARSALQNMNGSIGNSTVSFVLYFLPTYMLWINSIYIVTFLRYTGSARYVMATIISDKFRINNVMKYSVIEKE